MSPTHDAYMRYVPAPNIGDRPPTEDASLSDDLRMKRIAALKQEIETCIREMDQIIERQQSAKLISPRTEG